MRIEQARTIEQIIPTYLGTKRSFTRPVKVYVAYCASPDTVYVTRQKIPNATIPFVADGYAAPLGSSVIVPPGEWWLTTLRGDTRVVIEYL